MVAFNRATLPNGLTVLHEKRDVPVTTVMMAVRFGAMNEAAEEKGIAHFIEHLCFKGTNKRSAHAISSALESVGGMLNAFTHEELTAYHVRLPSMHLELGIDVISDIFFNPTFPAEEVTKEAQVIVEEIKMYHDNPRSHAFEMIKRNMYPEPFGMFTAGTKEIILSLSRDTLIRKHAAMYIPKNSVLCVVGNNEFSEVMRLAEQYASLTRSGAVLNPDISVPIQHHDTHEVRSDVLQSNLAIGIHLPVQKRTRYAALVFNAVLGEGMSSRLFTEVREKRGLAYAIKSHLDIGRNYASLIIFAGTDATTIDAVTELSLKEFHRLSQLSEEELAAAKVQVIGNMTVEQEGSNETALNLILHEFTGLAEDYYAFSENINAVTRADIQELAAIASYARFYVGP